ncbi:MAG: rod shape-determining protein MreC [candidate division WOR-3 bacterium]|jgi:rod shape-determining protein MreC
MSHKASISYRDRISWAIIILALIIAVLPTGVKFKICPPISTLVLFPLRGIAALRTVITANISENQRLSRLACELALENARLKSTSKTDTVLSTRQLTLMPAQIIVRDITTLKRFFIINKGKKHGVYPGAPCIAPPGIVGKVIATSEHQSLIQTILEPGFRIAVSNWRNGEVAMACPGDNDLLMLDYVKPDADFKVGDTVITSGLGGIFPKGLTVGVVIDIPERFSGVFRPVIVQPAVTITRLETVYIIIRANTGLPSDDHWLNNLQPVEIKLPE